MKSCIHVLAVVSLVVGAVVAEMDQATKDYILKVHNDYRTKQGASNMAQLKWDAQMETEAKAWAANCVFQHKGMGENLAWNSNTDSPETELIDKAMQAFYDEIKRYSYGQNSCGTSAACHYTQLVWAKTLKVGCATQVCEPLRNAYKKAWYLVCRYDPAGNWNGEKPFEKGTACSDCGGTGCFNGLCIGGSTDTDTDGGAPVAECKDNNGQCAMWAGNGECQNNPKYMLKECKQSCNECT